METREFLLKLEELLQKCNSVYSSNNTECYFLDDLKIIVTSNENGFNIDVTKDDFIKKLDSIPTNILDDFLKTYNDKFEDLIITDKNRDKLKKYIKSIIDKYESIVDKYENRVNSLKKLL